MTNPIEHIRKMQAALPDLPVDVVPEHKPEMLLIGCIDARLNISTDIGIPDGSALIKRNIAALVPPSDMDGSRGVGAALEFAIDKMRVKHVVVMGHTHCGGVAACLDEVHDVAIEEYLRPLEGKRAEVVERGGDKKEQARAMEREAVRLSMDNLLTYPVVEKALADGRIELHGWVIDTASKRLSVLDQETDKFHPMVEKDGPGKPPPTEHKCR